VCACVRVCVCVRVCGSACECVYVLCVYLPTSGCVLVRTRLFPYVSTFRYTLTMLDTLGG
jgi:hypothetical protein